MSSIAGELVTETFGYDGGRPVTAYVPPEPPEAVVFAGDGQLIGQWGAALEAAGGRPTLIVGAHRLGDEMARLHEYSPGFDPDRFAAHEEFLVGDVRRWAATRLGAALPADRTAVFGVSAGAELALALGLRHPDVYGAILCASPGAGYRPPAPMPSPLPRAYLVAGRQEPFFLENATRWADALRAAGADVVLAERDGTHGGAFWREEFPLMVAWAFGHQVAWSAAELERIDAAEELLIATERADGTWRPAVPIWVVRSGEEVYVRTWYRRDDGWFGHAVSSRRASIQVTGLKSDVTVEDIGHGSPGLRAGVDAAYRAKYGRYGAATVNRMVCDDAAATTVRLIPAKGRSNSLSRTVR